MENQFVIFKLGEETYGIKIDCVAEIIRMQAVTKMPKSLDFVEGVINLRGKVIPLVDLKKQFKLGETQNTKDIRIILVEMKQEIVGLLVERVSEVLSLDDEKIEPPSRMVSRVNTEFIQGIGKWNDQLIIILDPEKILLDQELQQLTELSLEQKNEEKSEEIISA